MECEKERERAGQNRERGGGEDGRIERGGGGRTAEGGWGGRGGKGEEVEGRREGGEAKSVGGWLLTRMGGCFG